MLTIWIYVFLRWGCFLYWTIVCAVSNVTTGSPNDSYNQIIDHSDIANDIGGQLVNFLLKEQSLIFLSMYVLISFSFFSLRGH
jgi:hypothetical protein